jgi:hypothetical protein
MVLKNFKKTNRFHERTKILCREKTKKGIVMGTRAWNKVGVNHWT